MHKIGILSAVAATAALVSMMPAPSAQATTLAFCTTGRVLVNFDSNMYTGWDSFTVRDTVTKGTELLCDNDGMDDPNVFIGRRYTACDETNGNGWIETNAVHIPGINVYIPQACAMDIHNG